jgi:hypothetical protein
MLQLLPKKNDVKSDDHISAEINQMLQNSDGWFIRIVYGFVKRLYAQFDTAAEMQKVA